MDGWMPGSPRERERELRRCIYDDEGGRVYLNITFRQGLARIEANLDNIDLGSSRSGE